MAESKSNQHQRSRSPRRSKSHYREIEQNKDSFKSDLSRRSKSHHREAGEITDSSKLSHFGKQQQQLIIGLQAKLNFLGKQNGDMICQLNALTADKDACVRKYETSDSASQLMAEKLIMQEENLKAIKEENQKLKNTVDEKRKRVLYYKNKSDLWIARAKELEKEVEDKNKEIDTMSFNMQAKERRIQELISQLNKGPEPKHPSVQVNSLLKTSVENALEMNQEAQDNTGDEIKEKEDNTVDSPGIHSKVSFMQIAQKVNRLKEQSLCSSPNALLTFSNLPATLFYQPSTLQSGNHSNKTVQSSDSSFSKQDDSENNLAIEVITID